MARPLLLPLGFDFVPYPLWRRRFPAALGTRLAPLWQRWLAADADTTPPTTPDAMARFLARWKLNRGETVEGICRALESDTQPLEQAPPADHTPIPYQGGPLRLPAQWEPLESVLLTWPVFYPPLWEAHSQMVEAITPVAEAVIHVPSETWGRAVRWWLTKRQADLTRVRIVVLPTDDIWIRDYGPFVGLDENGSQVVVDAIFDPLDTYPQERDDTMPARFAAGRGLPYKALDLHIEGGNLWSDGAGTLLMSDDVLHRHAELGREGVTERLHAVFQFEKLIITPHLRLEETNHIDLLVKLADARTIFIGAPTTGLNDARLRAAADLLHDETNTAGERYQLIQLPMPPLYLNWGIFPVWRSYTNALTVNGRVLLPVFGVPQDRRALDLYRRYMPDYEIIPVDCAATAPGGGAVHCLTKEVHARR